MKKSISLNGQWKLYFYDADDVRISNPGQLREKGIPSVAAQVPGNVELALAEAGIISRELFKGMTTSQNEKWEKFDWWYVTDFQTPMGLKSSDKVLLSFGAVDCFAEYYLNGEKVYASKNAFIEHEFDITGKLRPYSESAKNKIAVHIMSATKEACKRIFAQSDIHRKEAYAAHIRKPVHSFGWDIFPRAVSAGITRDVSVVVDDGISFRNVSYYVAGISERSAMIRFFFDIDAPFQVFSKNVKVRVRGACKDSLFDQTFDMRHFRAMSFEVHLRDPRLWWPSGYGEANLYDTTAELIVDDVVRDVKELNVGVRTAVLERTETLLEENHCFRFIINGVEVFLNGTNWVPLSPYHSVDAERYAQVLPMLMDIHCNIVRVWGGGVYEQEAFYDYCDRNGICVWQDFMMACVPVSQSEEIMEELRKEITAVVRRLRTHPSIIIWAGDNEIDEGLTFVDRDGDTNRITRTLIPEVLAAEDPYRAYLPSSPYLPKGTYKAYKDGQDIFVERHLWGARDYFKADFYRNSKAHFVSECGYHGCPSVESLKQVVDEEALWPIFNEQWSLHSSDQLGRMHRVRLMMDQVHQLFGFEPDRIEDFSLASQISQAEAKKFFIEHMRIRKPYTSGIIWWNLMDGWPQMSDAIVDYFFRKKLAYRYVKHSQQPIVLMLDEMRDWCYTLVGANDTLSPAVGSYRIFDIDSDETLAAGSFVLESNCPAKKLDRVRMFYSDKRFLVMEWNIDGKIYYNHYLAGMVPFDFAQYKKWLDKYSRLTGENSEF